MIALIMSQCDRPRLLESTTITNTISKQCFYPSQLLQLPKTDPVTGNRELRAGIMKQTRMRENSVRSRQCCRF